MKFLATACLFLASVADGSKFSDRATRNEFVRAMEQVSQQKKQEESFYKRLLRSAKPVTPEFMLERNLENDDAIAQYGLNLTDYALKYVGCQNIHTYSDELAEEGDSGTVLEMNRFVIIRLCPRDLCSNYNEFGCNSGFGDFMISMEEYLAAMADSYFNQYQEYCETCYYCKKQSQYSNNQYAQGDDAAAADGDDAVAADGDDAAAADGDDAAAADGDDAAAAGDDNRRDLANGDDANGSYYSDDKYNADADADADDCADYADVCDSFSQVCQDYSAKATNLQDYFECSEAVYANSIAYLGPHCRSDGKTIGIGIYDDQYCNDYIGDIVDISSYTGMDIQDDYLKAYYSEECISCLASESYELDADEDDQGSQVTDVCGVIYEESAKCNKYMGNDAAYESVAQEDTEDTVCTFIEALMTNSYDEYGEIVLQNGLAKWLSYLPAVSAMTTFQKSAMSFSVLLVTFLMGYACYLHRAINRHKLRWVPRKTRLGGDYETNPMQRLSSGILAGRSRSGAKFEHSGGILA